MSATARLILIATYLAWVVVASAIGAGLVAWDKRRARRVGWRVPEATLHLWELLGGWPGTLWARRRLRHKSVKRPYLLKARAMIALHLALTAGLVAVLLVVTG